MKSAILLLLGWFIIFTAHGQNRIKDYNNIGWYCYFGNHKLSKKLDLHTEYQWRRNHFIKTWQQSVARIGLGYKITDKLKGTIGYAFIETYPYGDYPSEKTAYPENRIYEELKLKTPIKKFDIENRIRLEQRFVAKLAENKGHEIATWNYKNRFRYQLKFDFAFKGTTIDPKEAFLTAYEEIFIRFGQNLGKNCFDQNRVFAGLGYRISKPLKFEAGYFYQLSKHERKEKDTDKYVFEYNKGFIISMYYDINFTKSE